MRVLSYLGLWFGFVGVGRKGRSDSHLPEIAEEERIRVHTPKIRKHATKRRGNKLHDRSMLKK